MISTSQQRHFSAYPHTEVGKRRSIEQNSSNFPIAGYVFAHFSRVDCRELHIVGEKSSQKSGLLGFSIHSPTRRCMGYSPRNHPHYH